MRKGLVVTLGVALALSVATSFAEAPIISCLPDIVISDFDKTQQTADTNLFVFENALDLDEYVQDADTTDSQIRWSFIETSGADIQILPDGGSTWIGEITAGQQLEPGTSNIRGGDGTIDIRNTSMTGTTVGSRVSTLEFWVSDGVASRSETVLVTTVNTNGTTGSAVDALVPPVAKSWTFQSGLEGWTWDDLFASSGYIAPAHQAANGSLEMTKSANQTTITYGSYQSPKDPTNGLRPRPGCILRAKFLLRSTTTASGGGASKHPGFRLMAITGHVIYFGGVWQLNWASQDFLDDTKVLWNPIDIFHIAGREPGTTGQTYTILSYPFQAAETLLATDTVTYVACDLLDMQYAENDLGTLYVDEVNVDSVDRPELGSGTPVNALTSTTFAAGSWATQKTDLGGMNDANLTYSVLNNALTVTATPGNQFFEIIFSLADGHRVPLTAGNWYRLNWMISTTEQAGDYIVPTVRTALRSERFIWIAQKELKGGGLVARFGSTPTETEVWAVAPSALSGTQTEPMSPVFEGWGLASQTGWPFFKTIAGTVRAHSVRVEGFAPIP